MQQRSSMFLNDITNVDHAYIDDKGMIKGGSVRPKMIVSGLVDPVENVVIDFSTVKKTIKKVIDDPEKGFDHKLWWFEGISGGSIDLKGDRIIIKTDHVEIEGPVGIVRYVSEDETVIRTHVTRNLDSIYSDIDIHVECDLTHGFDTPHRMNTQPHQFRMVHGLKYSTSIPCQNIAHGHLNFLGAETEDVLSSNITLSKIANSLDGKVFTWSSNVSNKHKGLIKYRCSRGEMMMMIDESSLIVMDQESTVENIVSWIANRWRKELKESGVTQLYCSEGLSKGASFKTKD
jgi:hypothetical protein